MKEQFKEINFVSNSSSGFQFECINYQDLLKKKPTDHSQFEFHKVSFYGIFLCTHNSGDYNINFKDHNFKKGTLFTLRKDNVHKFYRNNAKGLLLVFTDNFVLSYSNQLEASKTFLLFNEMLASPKLQLNETEFKEVTTLIKLIQDEYHAAKDDHSVSIIRNFVQVIIAKLFRIKLKGNVVFENQKYLSKFLNLQALVEKECFQNKTVTYYAKTLGVTPKTLNNITQSILNKSAKTFINEIVIIQSKRLIINSTDSLTEIAFQTGFDESTNFFKYFRKYAGLSPSEFRVSHQSA